MRKVERKSVPAPASLVGAECSGVKELEKARAYYNDLAKNLNPSAVVKGKKRKLAKTKAKKPTDLIESKKSFEFKAYKSDDVRHALFALFHGKCAYCEARYDTTAPVDIEHFRPKGGIDGTEHLGYWWFAATWSNLLPSCIDCNRKREHPTPREFSSLTAILDERLQKGFTPLSTGKGTCFPIQDEVNRIVVEPPAGDVERMVQAEGALLLDPCIDEPGDHLRFFIDRANLIGIVFAAPDNQSGNGDLPIYAPDVAKIEQAARDAGVSARGAVSIQVYGLNRLALVQERTRLLRRLDFLATLAIDMYKLVDQLEPQISHTANQQPWKDAVQKMRVMADNLIAELRSMAGPSAPFSAMVNSWLQVFIADLKAARAASAQNAAPPPAHRPRARHGVRQINLHNGAS